MIHCNAAHDVTSGLIFSRKTSSQILGGTIKPHRLRVQEVSEVVCDITTLREQNLQVEHLPECCLKRSKKLNLQIY